MAQLTTAVVTVGRENCDIILDSGFVGRRQARLVWKAPDYVLTDLNSRNPTLVNGRQISEPHTLRHRDVIHFADVEAIFESPATPVDPNLTPALPVSLPSVRAKTSPVFLDEGRHEVYVDGEMVDVSLSPNEFELFRLIWQAGGDVVARDELCQAIWPTGYLHTDLYRLVSRLKQKLRDAGARPDLIRNVPGAGYRLAI